MLEPHIDNSDIVKAVAIEAAASAVWRLLTDPELIPRWMWEEDLQVIADWHTGGRFVIRGKLHGVRFENRGTITAFEPERLFEYNYWSTLSRARLAELPANTTTVRFALASRGAVTDLTLTLRGFPEASIRPHVNLYWGPTLQIIKQLAEKSTRDGSR